MKRLKLLLLRVTVFVLHDVENFYDPSSKRKENVATMWSF